MLKIDRYVTKLSGLKEASNLVADVKIDAYIPGSDEVVPMEIRATIPLPKSMREESVSAAREAAIKASEALISDEAISHHFRNIGIEAA